MKFQLKYFVILTGVFSVMMSCKKKSSQIVSVENLPYFNTADFSPEWENATHKIPEFSFVNQNGKTISNKTFEGYIYVADFFFTSCPGICPELTKNMGTLQEFYKDDTNIKLISYTVMPWKDSVPVLNNYALKNNINSEKWQVVTGEKDALYDMARNGYFADEDFTKTQDESNLIHTENFVLVDKSGHIRGVYNGTIEVDIERLKRHINILKKES